MIILTAFTFRILGNRILNLSIFGFGFVGITIVALSAVPDVLIVMPMLLAIFASVVPIIYYVRNTEEQQRRNFWAFKQQISRIELTKSEMLALVTEKERLSQALSSKQRELDARCGPSAVEEALFRQHRSRIKRIVKASITHTPMET